MASRSNLKVASIRAAWKPPVRVHQSAEGEGKVSSIHIDLSGFRPEDVATVKLRLEGDKITITGSRVIVPEPPQVNVWKKPDGGLGTSLITEQQDFTFEYSLEAVDSSRDNPDNLEAYYNPEGGTYYDRELSIHVLTGADEIVEDVLHGRGHDFPWRKGEPFPIEIVTREPQQPIVPPLVLPHTTPPETEIQKQRRQMLDYEKSFVQDGVRYFPLSAAAPVVQAPAPTILHWIKKKPPTKFGGEPLQSFYFAPANQYFISEESIYRAADRFIRWPSEEPAGPITLGEQRDQSGYIGLTDAARTIGIDHHTMWRWTTKGTAPTAKPLDVIKCPASDQLYIRQKDVTALKKLVPRSGLRAGRRSQPALQNG